MFWLFLDQKLSLTFEQVPAWFQKEWHFPVENLLVKNILTDSARVETEGDCRRNKCYGFSAWVILLSLPLSIWRVYGPEMELVLGHTQLDTSFLALDNSYGVPVTCPALCSAERPTLVITQRSSEIIPPIGTLMEKEDLVVSCSAWFRGSWFCTLVCTCPFQALYRRDIQDQQTWY